MYSGAGYSTKADVYSLSIVLWELMVRHSKGVYERPYAEFKNLTAGFQVIMKVLSRPLVYTPLSCSARLQDRTSDLPSRLIRHPCW